MTGMTPEAAQRTTRWWWVRHAPVAGAGDRFPGRDGGKAALDDAGLAALAARLPSDALWLASPIERAAATAAALGVAVRAAAPVAEAGLAEQDFGDWEGRSYDEVWGSDAGRAFWDAPATSRPPGGESFAEMVGRVTEAIGRWTARGAGRDIVAVCHAGTVRAALCYALGLAPEAALGFEIDPLSLTRIDHLGPAHAAWRIGVVNRTTDATED